MFHLPYDPELKKKARELRKNMTNSEKKLWYEYLRNFRFNFLKQKPIDKYIVDFYCPKIKLVIEIDGDTHYSDENELYDNKRTEVLESYGLKVIRFTNTDILKNLEEVVRKIEEEIPPYPPLIKGGKGG